VNRLGAPTLDDLVAFAHATLFSPALSTLEKTLIKNYLTNFPGLTLNHLRRHPPASIPMTKRHMDQARKTPTLNKDHDTAGHHRARHRRSMHC
jgi:hypothetical protein